MIIHTKVDINYYLCKMKLSITNRFLKSFAEMKNRQTFIWKGLDFIRYGIPNFIKNIWLFRKALFNYRWWDHRGVMEFMSISFGDMSKNVDIKGNEVEISRKKKVSKMIAAQYILERFVNDDFIELAEKELGEIPYKPLEFKPVEDRPGYYEIVDDDTAEEKEHKDKVYKRSRELEEQMWAQLWDILKGQDFSKFKDVSENIKDYEEQYKHWEDKFDGSGLRGWWD